MTPKDDDAATWPAKLSVPEGTVVRATGDTVTVGTLGTYSADVQGTGIGITLNPDRHPSDPFGPIDPRAKVEHPDGTVEYGPWPMSRRAARRARRAASDKENRT